MYITFSEPSSKVEIPGSYDPKSHTNMNHLDEVCGLITESSKFNFNTEYSMKTTEELRSMCSELRHENFVCSHRPLTKEGVLEMAREYALKRMEHCEALLLQHLEEGDAKSVSNGQIIVWPQGHFSFPVYEALEEFVRGKRDFFKDSLIAQQVAKEITFEGIYGGRYDYETLYVFNVAMEICLVASQNFK